MLQAMIIHIENSTAMIPDMIRFHYAAGIQHFILAHTRCSDNAPDFSQIVDGCKIEHVTYPGGGEAPEGWLQKISQEVQKAHPTRWIITAEVGEFWLPTRGNLKTFFKDLPEAAVTIEVGRFPAAKGNDGCIPHPRNAAYFEIGSDAIILSRTTPRKVAPKRQSGAIRDDLLVFTFPGAEAIAAATPPEHTPPAPLTRELTLLRLTGQAFEDQRLQSALEQNQWPVAQINPTLAALAEKSEDLAAEAFGQFVPKSSGPRTVSGTVSRGLPFFVAGAYRQASLLRQIGMTSRAEDLANNFPHFRDIFSLFPRNDGFHDLLKKAVHQFFPSDFARLNNDTAGKTVILHLSCVARLDQAIASVESFGDDASLHHVIIVGSETPISENETPLSFSYNGTILSVPVPDIYDSLHRKLFYGYLLFSLLDQRPYVVKIDDDTHLANRALFDQLLAQIREERMDAAGYDVGDVPHIKQLHGWHIGKVTNHIWNNRGYQYPLARHYPAGGYGYVLSPNAISACASMYLSMKAFFDIDAIGLEDVYVGHALHGWNLEMSCVFGIRGGWLTLSGLKAING